MRLEFITGLALGLLLFGVFATSNWLWGDEPLIGSSRPHGAVECRIQEVARDEVRVTYLLTMPLSKYREWRENKTAFVLPPPAPDGL